jgi:hypothetical protein
MSNYRKVYSFDKLMSRRNGKCRYITGEAHGLKYIIAFVLGVHYTAYVNVPKGSDIYGVHQEWLLNDSPDVYGSITYSGDIGIDQDGLYYFGWDYIMCGKMGSAYKELTYTDIMVHVNNCAKWINKLKHDVECNECSSKISHKLFKDSCKHTQESYLGSDSKNDYYLYIEQGISICQRFGEDGNYKTISYSNDPKFFIEKLTQISRLQQQTWKEITHE